MKTCIMDIENLLTSLFPLENALGYDNPGLMTGSSSAYTSGVVLSLDVTSSAIELCENKGVNLLITHHPLIFGGINTVSIDNSKGRLISSLIKRDIACYACHTNLDMTGEFGNLAIAEALDAVNPMHLEGVSCGVIFELPKKDVLKNYAKKVTESLNSSGVITINSPDAPVSRVFVQGGAFDEDSMDAVIKSGADLIISGEIKHHLCVELEACGVSTLIAGHNATERIYLPKLKNVLAESFPGLEIFVDFGNERNMI